MNLNPSVALWGMYYLGWTVHLLAQMHRSVVSGSNGLKGLSGAKHWLRLQIVPILVRGWASTIYFGVHHSHIAQHVSSVMPLNIWSAAQMGFLADELLDKFLVLIFPSTWPNGLRVDIPQLVPPKESTNGQV